MIRLDRGRMQQGASSITLDATGDLATAVTVTYPQTFDYAPKVTVIAPFGSTQANYTASTITTTSFSIAVATETASNFQGESFYVEWTAVEPA